MSVRVCDRRADSIQIRGRPHLRERTPGFLLTAAIEVRPEISRILILHFSGATSGPRQDRRRVSDCRRCLLKSARTRGSSLARSSAIFWSKTRPEFRTHVQQAPAREAKNQRRRGIEIVQVQILEAFDDAASSVQISTRPSRSVSAALKNCPPEMLRNNSGGVRRE